MSGRLRHHSWFKVKLHNYICDKCGVRKINVVQGDSWTTEWHLLDGSTRRQPLAPACVEGSETTARLAWLASFKAQIAAAAVPLV